MAIQTFEELEVYAGFKYEASLSTSLLSYALTISPSHIAFGSLSGNSYAGNDLPDSGYNTSTFYINCRNANSISVYLTPDNNLLSPQLNKYTGTWSGWQSIGGDNKFIKGQAIPFYDTDGETLLNSVLPENLVYYDGESGDEITSNFIWAKPSSNKTMTTASTFYSPTFETVLSSKGIGFEISNGDIKCNKNGKVKVTVQLFTSGSSSTSTWANIAINGVRDDNAHTYNGALTYNNIYLQGVYSVAAGDLINVQCASWVANYTLQRTTTILCEYVEDYYITREMPDIDKVYPVGSIYMSVNNTNPSLLFGGTWTQIKDTFLLSAGDTYTAGDTGGEATHTLTTNEMPSHSHAWSRRNTSSVASGTGLTGASGTEYAGDITEAIRATGGGQAHNNMPPYLVVYMWQRTA